MSLKSEMPLIGIDWGSSSFRGYLISNTGEILDIIRTETGVFQLSEKDFFVYLDSTCRAWICQYPGISIVMSGMVGSRNGWQEVPYQDCPLSKKTLSNNLAVVETEGSHNIYIVPGARCKSVNSQGEVMRGEEVQILGALKCLNKEQGLVCLPGTHSKWANVKAQTLFDFATFFSGELFSLLVRQSTLIASCDLSNGLENIVEQAFFQGVEYSRFKGGLLHQIFFTRAGVLLGDLAEKEACSFLSGVIIGHELQGAMQLYPGQSEVTLVGASRLQSLYAKAGRIFGINMIETDADKVFVAGLFDIAKQHFCSGTAAN